MVLNPYLKFLVALLGPLVTALGTIYGTLPWWPAVATGIAAILVYLVPNTGTTVVVPPKAP